MWRAFVEGIGALFYLPVSERKSARYRWTVLVGFLVGLALFAFLAVASDRKAQDGSGEVISSPPALP